MSSLSHHDLASALWEYHKQPKVPGAAHWRAESFRATEGQPMTLRRAKALTAVLEQCNYICVPGELLVGVGHLGRYVSEGTCDGTLLKVDQEYLAGIGARDFGTHADHLAPNYAKLLRLGLGGLHQEILQSLHDRRNQNEKDFLQSALLAVQGASEHLRRWAQRLLIASRENPEHAELLTSQAARMDRLAEAAPHSFPDALQLVLSFHCMMQLDDRSAMAFGRMDQYLHPFYAADKAARRMTDQLVQDYLDHFFAKITVDGDVLNITLAGVKGDDGSDATNELSYMILEACKRVGRPGGNCTARIARSTPPAFLRKCAEVIRTGIGYPALFNDDLEVQALLSQGYPLQDARDYCFVGCIEVFIPGRQAPWADDRANPLHCLNLTLFDGVDSLTGGRVSSPSGPLDTYEDFYQAFLAQCRMQVDKLIADNIARQQECLAHPEYFTSPLMSVLVDDCIARGHDHNDGGAVYPANFGYGGMGVASVADTLTAIRKFVYEQRVFTLQQVREMLLADFEGYQAQRELLMRKVPKFGNDDDYVDSIAARFVADLSAMFVGRRNGQGGFYWLLMAANVQNIWGGQQVGATADGRRSREPLSDACSPTFGRDLRGPTAVIRSVAKLPYQLCPGGNVVNMKLDPHCLRGKQGLDRLAALARACFDLGGCQLQFNTTGRETLEEAMANPRKHENLVVRVSGFSFNFTWLDPSVQKDILARTEHRLG